MSDSRNALIQAHFDLSRAKAALIKATQSMRSHGMEKEAMELAETALRIDHGIEKVFAMIDDSVPSVL